MKCFEPEHRSISSVSALAHLQVSDSSDILPPAFISLPALAAMFYHGQPGRAAAGIVTHRFQKEDWS